LISEGTKTASGPNCDYCRNAAHHPSSGKTERRQTSMQAEKARSSLSVIHQLDVSDELKRAGKNNVINQG
jgi:hypothetical protein